MDGQIERKKEKEVKMEVDQQRARDESFKEVPSFIHWDQR